MKRCTSGMLGALLGAMLALTSSSGAAETPAGYPAAVRTVRLANGLRVALAPDTMASTVDVSLWFPAGSRYERTGRSGLTHLFDGLLFAGTRAHPSGDQQRLIQREGGSLTAASSADYAVVENNVAPSSLRLALELEADRMAYLSITPQTFEAARAGMRNERARSAARGDLGRGVRRLYSVAFAGHPYHRPAEGTEEDLDHLTLLDAQNWWRDHYGPAGTWLVLAGRFDPDSAMSLVKRTLGTIPARGAARAEPPAPPPITVRRALGRVTSPIPVLVVGWRTPSVSDASASAIEALDRWLTAHKPSRLEAELVTDSSACLALNAGLDLRRDAGLLYVAVAVRPEADSAAVEQLVIDTVERLGTRSPDQEEMRSLARQAAVETLFGWQTSQGVGEAVGNSAIVEGDVNAAAARLVRGGRLTSAEFGEVAHRILNAQNRVVVWMRPGPTPSPPGRGAAPAPNARRSITLGPRAKGGR